jgi:hypothetical protein
MQSAAQAARNRLGVAARLGSPADVEQARRDLAAANLEESIRRLVGDAPPLTEQQLAGAYAALDHAPRAQALT